MVRLVTHDEAHRLRNLYRHYIDRCNTLASGASIKGVQSMLGHTSAAMTLDRYGHLFGDELDAVADRMAAARADWLRTEGVSAPVQHLG